MANKLTTTFEFQVKDALKRIAELNKGLADTEGSLEDVESAGKVAARALSAAADAIETDLKDTQEAADALARALGPELAAKADTSAIIADLKAMGLTTADVKADAEELAAALARLEQVGKQAGPNVKAAFDDIDRASAQVGRTTDNTRSVVANFAGNAVQELPGVSAAMGPLNMAIGQFAEYATEGNIGFKNFLKAGLGLGGLSIALMGVSKIMDIFGENAEQAREQQEALNRAVKAFRDGKTQEAAQEIVNAYGGLIAKGREWGFTTSEVIQAIVGDYDLAGAAARKLSEERQNTDELGLVGLQRYENELNDFVGDIQDANGEWRENSLAIDENAAIVAEVTSELTKGSAAQKDVARQLGASRAAQDAYNDELDRNIGLMDDILPDLYDYEQSTYDLADAVDEAREAQKQANDVAADAAATDAERAAALREAREATMGAGQAAFDSAAKYATQKGAVEGSKQQIDLMIEELQRQAEKYPELRGEIDQYIAKLKQIPTTINTTVKLRGPQGDISRDDAQKLGLKGFRTGTSDTGPRPYIAHEGELIVPGGSGDQVISAGRTEHMLRNSGGSSTSGGIVINLYGSQATPEAVVSAIKQYERRNGNSWRQ